MLQSKRARSSRWDVFFTEGVRSDPPINLMTLAARREKRATPSPLCADIALSFRGLTWVPGKGANERCQKAPA